MFAGLRISEALALRWRDVHLAGRKLRVADSKMYAGVRWVPLMPAVRDELLCARPTPATGVDGPRVRDRDGGPLSSDNTRTRILARAHEIADALLAEQGFAPLPERLTQHSMRHTYVSLRVELGDDPAAIAEDAGHADVSEYHRRIYTHVMRLAAGDRERLRVLVDGCGEWAPMGTTPASLAAAA